MTLDDYILQHTSPEPDYLYRLWRATTLQTVHGRMASGHLHGRLLIPSVMLRAEGDVFLDDVSREDVERELGVRLIVVSNDGAALLDAIIAAR